MPSRKCQLYFFSCVLLFFAVELSAQSYTTKKTATGKLKKLYDKATDYNRSENWDKALNTLR